MSRGKNRELLESILKENLLALNKNAIVDRMLKTELAGQKVFYRWLQQKGYDINPLDLDKNQSDGIIGNTIIECKLNENEGGGPQKAYLELYNIIPTRLKGNGEPIPYYRIYVELETFLVEVYTCHFDLVDTFNWYDNSEKFKKYFEDKKKTFEYDLTDTSVDLVSVIHKIYKIYGIKTKVEAYKIIERGVIGWFKSFDFKKDNISRIILNNDKMNERMIQKYQGAFFTPHKYAEIAKDMVESAIKNIKKDGYEDYVIIDRCAGVGNLEAVFDEKYFNHMILGTLNEGETLVANIRFGRDNFVKVVDALSEEGVEFYRKEIENYKQKNKVEKLAVIFLENPPYVVLNSNKKGGVASGSKEKTWVHQQMDKGGQDLDEQFVFSVFNMYDTYRYIHFGPIKIWKSKHLITKQVFDAYLCDREKFNASKGSIALISWGNEDKDYESIIFRTDTGNEKVEVKKVYKTISSLYENDGEKGIIYIEARNFSYESPRLTGSMNSDGRYGTKKVSKENLPKVIPLFCAARNKYCETGIYKDKSYDYTPIGTLYKTGDGGLKYLEDKEFVYNCIQWATFTHLNQVDSDSDYWKWAYDYLEKHKKLLWDKCYDDYMFLVKEVGLNGLYNIESFERKDKGKLWKYHNLFPRIKNLKSNLDVNYEDHIHPELIKYELIK